MWWGLGLVVLASCPTLYGKVPRLILKKTNRLTQAVVSSRRYFCAARCCEIVRQQTVNAYLHIYDGNAQQNPLCAASCVTTCKDLPFSPRFSPTTFYRDANSVLLRAHVCTAILLGSIRKTLCLKLFIRRA